MTAPFSALQPVLRAPSWLPGASRPPAECRPLPANPRRKLVRNELLSRAADVSAQQGLAQTRMHDIVAAVSLIPSALYHYVTRKEEIFAALVEEHTQAQAEVLRHLAGDTARAATDRLREALRATVFARLSGGARLRVLDQLAVEMPPGPCKVFDGDRRQILDAYTAIITDGIGRGEFRPVDARTVALAVLGIASWTSCWYSPGGRESPEELADLLVDMGMNGLAVAGPPANDRPGEL